MKNFKNTFAANWDFFCRQMMAASKNWKTLMVTASMGAPAAPSLSRLAAGIGIAGSTAGLVTTVTSCGDDNTLPPEPIPEPPKPAKIDTLTYDFTNPLGVTATSYLRSKIQEMETYSKGEHLGTKRMRIIAGRFGLAADLPDLIQKMLGITKAPNVISYDGKNLAICADKDKDPLLYDDWVARYDALSIVLGPNGEKCGIKPQEWFKFINDGVNPDVLYKLVPEGAAEITIGIPGKLGAEAEEIRKYLEELGYLAVVAEIDQDIPVTGDNMDIVKVLSVLNADGQIIWIGNGAFVSGGNRVPADGDMLSKLKLGENKENPEFRFYVTENIDKIEFMGMRFDAPPTQLGKLKEGSFARHDALNFAHGDNPFDARKIANYKGETKTIPITVPYGVTLEMENFSTDAASTMMTKAVLDYYWIGWGRDPKNIDLDNIEGLPVGNNGPFKLLDTSGKFVNIIITSLHLGRDDPIYECYYHVDDLDVSNGLFTTLEWSWDNTKKAPKITKDGENKIDIKWNRFGTYRKSALPGGDTEMLFSTSFYKKISAILGLKENNMWYILETRRLTTAYESDAATGFDQNLTMQPSGARQWLAPYNLDVPDGHVPAISIQDCRTLLPDKCIRMADGWETPKDRQSSPAYERNASGLWVPKRYSQNVPSKNKESESDKPKSESKVFDEIKWSVLDKTKNGVVVPNLFVSALEKFHGKEKGAA